MPFSAWFGLFECISQSIWNQSSNAFVWLIVYSITCEQGSHSLIIAITLQIWIYILDLDHEFFWKPTSSSNLGIFSFPNLFRLHEMKIHTIRCVNDEHRRTMQWRNREFGAHEHFSRLFFSAVWQFSEWNTNWKWKIFFSFVGPKAAAGFAEMQMSHAQCVNMSLDYYVLRFQPQNRFFSLSCTMLSWELTAVDGAAVAHCKVFKIHVQCSCSFITFW